MTVGSLSLPHDAAALPQSFNTTGVPPILSGERAHAPMQQASNSATARALALLHACCLASRPLRWLGIHAGQ